MTEAKEYKADYFDHTWSPYQRLAAWVIIEAEIEIEEIRRHLTNPTAYRKKNMSEHGLKDRLEEILEWIHSDSTEETSLHFWASQITEYPNAIARFLKAKYPRGTNEN